MNRDPVLKLLPANSLQIGLALGVVTVFLGSIVAAGAKHLSNQLSIATIVLAQYLICFLMSLPWLIKHGGLKALKTDYPWQHIVRGFSGCACFYTFFIALKHIPLVDATLLRNTAPLIVPLVILVWMRVGVPRSRWLPLIIGFIGIAVILKPGEQGASVWHLVAFSSGIGLAVSMVATRVLAKTEPESRILFYYYAISLIFAVPFFIFNYEPIPVLTWPWLVGIGAAMYFTFALYTRAYRYVKASVLAPTSYFAVVFAGLLDWIVWDHLPDIWVICGTILVVGGGILSLYIANIQDQQPIPANQNGRHEE